MRSHFFKILLAIVLGNLIAPSLNYAVDPARRWHSDGPRIGSNWSDDRVLSAPRNFDERKFRAKHIPVIAPPELILFGSSRVMMADSQMFRVPMYNAGVSGGMVPDFVGLWQQISEEKKVPKHVLIFLDASNLNAATVRTTWMTNARFVRNFLTKYPDNKSGLVVPPSEEKKFNTSSLEAEIKDMMSLTMTLASLKEIYNGKLSEWELRPVSEYPNDGPGYSSDGSFFEPKKDMFPGYRADFEALPAPGTYVRDEFLNWSLNREAVELLKLLLKDMKNIGVSTYVLIPPVWSEFMEWMKQQPFYAQYDHDINETFAKLKAENLVDDTCYILDPKNTGCSQTEYMNYSHMRKTCYQKVLRSCFEKSGNSHWTDLLTDYQERWK